MHQCNKCALRNSSILMAPGSGITLSSKGSGLTQKGHQQFLYFEVLSPSQFMNHMLSFYVFLIPTKVEKEEEETRLF